MILRVQESLDFRLDIKTKTNQFVAESAAASKPVAPHCSSGVCLLPSSVAAHLGATVVAMVAPPHLSAVSQDSELRIRCCGHVNIYVRTQQKSLPGKFCIESYLTLIITLL